MSLRMAVRRLRRARLTSVVFGSVKASELLGTSEVRTPKNAANPSASAMSHDSIARTATLSRMRSLCLGKVCATNAGAHVASLSRSTTVTQGANRAALLYAGRRCSRYGLPLPPYTAPSASPACSMRRLATTSSVIPSTRMLIGKPAPRRVFNRRTGSTALRARASCAGSPLRPPSARFQGVPGLRAGFLQTPLTCRSLRE